MTRGRRWLVAILACLLAVAAAFALAVGHPVEAVRLVLERPAGSLPVPVDGIRPRDLADTWGAPRGGGRKHRGIDIFAPRGTPVRSATDGLVLRVGDSRLGGQVVWVLGPGGRMHYHAHLDRYGTFRRGDLVRRGDVIGYVGDTGNARGTPTHLHYGVYSLSRVAMNPYPLLVATGPR